MIANLTAARNQIIGVFTAAWTDPVRFDDVAGSVPNSGTWARLTVRHVTGSQASLSDQVGSVKWENNGFVVAQIFTPFGDGLAVADAKAEAVANAYRTATGLDVWFRNVRINEVGRDGDFQQTNVLVDFTYDLAR